MYVLFPPPQKFASCIYLDILQEYREVYIILINVKYSFSRKMSEYTKCLERTGIKC